MTKAHPEGATVAWGRQMCLLGRPLAGGLGAAPYRALGLSTGVGFPRMVTRKHGRLL